MKRVSHPLQSLVWVAMIMAMACTSDKKSLNRLGQASSPYLREHADNPVDWYEWSDEALKKAEREGKPLIVSIGYASCHWCHVMEEETFMDTAVARLMNENFVSIKVDREERPDIDQIYINAAQLVSGNAGWPLNAFALPDGRPFYAATYFPKDQWVQLLRRIAGSYHNDQQNIRRQAAAITKGIQTLDELVPAMDSSTASTIHYERIFEQWSTSVDTLKGGLSGAPKFPMPVVWDFVLQHYFITSDADALMMVTKTLDHMAAGGIYDHLGGGFARYATDSSWRVPHFEKMLYDNAQLVSLYAKAYQVTRNPSYAQVVKESIEFIDTELRHDDGAYYSSINADSEGEEGRFYAWTKEEITNALDNNTADLVISTYHVTEGGNWEDGKNVLYVEPSVQIAGSALESLNKARKKLLSRRDDRVRPTTDEKILTSWNALMIEAYLQAYMALKDDAYLRSAIACAKFLERDRVNDAGHVWRTTSDDRNSIEGFLDDYALLAHAYIKLYQATFDQHWLTLAKRIVDYSVAHFQNAGSGLYYYSLDESAQQIARKAEVSDQVMPSSNSVLAESLLLLGEYFQDEAYTDKGTEMVSQVSVTMDDAGPYLANWARLMAITLFKPYEVVIIGPKATAYRSEMMSHYLPTAIMMGGESESLPLMVNKLEKGKTMIYVCRDRVCKFPVETVKQALEQIR